MSAAQGCSNIVVRRDILSLSPGEWSRVANVLRRMNDEGWFQYFSYIHNAEFGNIHGNDMFFPWHRRFVRDFEEIGQRYDSGFAVPYWDVLRDYRNPGGSPVFYPQLMGSNGWGRCVPNGVHQGWTLTFPNNHCLSRAFDRGGGIQPWYSPEYIYSVMQRDGSMNEFRQHIEFTIHGSVHLGIGGDMGTYWSPNDFIFMLHHANLDRLWQQWQNWGHQFTMDGRDARGNWVGMRSRIPHYGDEVGSTMQLGINRMCFQYAGGGSRAMSFSAAGRNESHLSLVSVPPIKGTNGNTEANLTGLPEHILQKWFPRLAKAKNMAKPRNATRSAISSSINAGGQVLVPPTKLTDAWIEMHKFDRSSVDKIMEEAQEFVNDMNSVNYLSPF
ncbi:hypothetical protein FBU59_002847 [Linderina macrospora]|uniref:Uncharacterized protein n=1 Tax=Linderina macrospora TaxID=4868 RepID=A0ACC1JAA5_9FUNG|nr:hypothetical protein FBU59_002847 [Linderina macrospora]